MTAPRPWCGCRDGRAACASSTGTPSSARRASSPASPRYAPGLDVDDSVCGVHIVDVERGATVASLTWPGGNQIFAVDWLPAGLASGFVAGRPDVDTAAVEAAWYQFSPPSWRLAPQPGG